MASAKNAEVRVLDRRSRRGRHRAFRRGHARSTRKTLFPSSRSTLPSLRLLMPSLSHASRMFSDRRDLFIFPSYHQEARRPVPAPARASPRPRTRRLPGPARPPSPLPRRLPRMRRRPRPRPRPPPAREHPRRSRPSGAAVPPQRTSSAAVDRSLPRHRYAPVPASHRNRIAIVFFGFFWIYQTICQTTQPHTKPIHPTSTPSIHSPRSSPSRASARSPRPPPTEEAVTSPNRAPSPSPDRSEARISKTQKTPSRGPSTARNPTRLLESLYRLPTSAASPRPTRTRALTTDGASRMRR